MSDPRDRTGISRAHGIRPRHQAAHARDRTIAEAEAYAEGLASAAVAARAMARRIKASVAQDADAEHASTLVALANAATLELFADTLAEQPQRREPDGLSYRGG